MLVIVEMDFPSNLCEYSKDSWVITQWDNSGNDKIWIYGYNHIYGCIQGIQ